MKQSLAVVLVAISMLPVTSCASVEPAVSPVPDLFASGSPLSPNRGPESPPPVPPFCSLETAKTIARAYLRAEHELEPDSVQFGEAYGGRNGSWFIPVDHPEFPSDLCVSADRTCYFVSMLCGTGDLRK